MNHVDKQKNKVPKQVIILTKMFWMKLFTIRAECNAYMKCEQLKKRKQEENLHHSTATGMYSSTYHLECPKQTLVHFVMSCRRRLAVQKMTQSCCRKQEDIAPLKS
jgi:hypothetical protein